MSTAGAEPTGLYFDPFHPDRAFVNVQHANSDIDRTIAFGTVPEPATFVICLAGFGLICILRRIATRPQITSR